MWNLGIRLWAAWRFTLFLALAGGVLYVIYRVDGIGKVFGWALLILLGCTVAVYWALRDLVRREIGHRAIGRL
ncbi:hypothetical protein FKR81_04385 [Lentzea tibetensis]|uniref:Uncharacterized protein n=1 Tax=Lentzea tibetensis TaxID=2591470 RepID=A0A563EZS1_9PSEU|nr:hypothetical protein [Lentzea tibetensis]TWP53215.1 hypothetical protein FKR81_04385 [Lentzea tibetensis]